MNLKKKEKNCQLHFALNGQTTNQKSPSNTGHCFLKALETHPQSLEKYWLRI
jgi:hypothetical protein